MIPSVGADRIRPNVTGLSRSLNGTVSDVAPFNRDIPLSGGGRYIKVSQKTKPFFALWDACHATTMALHHAGVFPSLGEPGWGKFFVVCLLGGFTGSCGELHGNAQSINGLCEVVTKVVSIFTLIPYVNGNFGGVC